MKLNHITTIYLKKAAPFLLLLVLLSACGGQKEVVLSGATMGTTYQVKVIAGYFKSTSGLKEKIENRLLAINQSMSTYLQDSEISRFNAIRDTQEKLAVSDDFLQVMLAARDIYQKSGGAWDGTIKPLLNLWGFGNTKQTRRVPDEAEIKKQMRWIGFQHIDIFPKGYLQKKKNTLTLDLASIAKGYAVDQVSDLLRASGINNFLVEIGGEVFAAGFRKDGQPWRVGINQPSTSASIADVYRVVPLHNRAMATSGDYRNYFEDKGRRFSHIIDPRTGYPVNNGVVSVSIVADSCMFADGLATAIMVMGREHGMTLINSLNDVEGFIIVRKTDGDIVPYMTDAFRILTP
ncbi:MAG: FAD:protein FMN transferase [Deltaproteobacteria bacterium]|nr:FAD:protein FMN transferase [Deltaproteobacteria bacterium]